METLRREIGKKRGKITNEDDDDDFEWGDGDWVLPDDDEDDEIRSREIETDRRELTPLWIEDDDTTANSDDPQLNSDDQQPIKREK